MSRMRVGQRAGASLLIFVALLLSSSLGVVPVQAAADEWDEWDVEMSAVTMALGVGYSWGSGTLRLASGPTHSFNVDNVKVGAIGVSNVRASGKARIRKGKVEEFSGTYVAVEAGLVVGGGGSVLTMRNQNGVVITLQSVQTGVALILGPGGMTLELN